MRSPSTTLTNIPRADWARRREPVAKTKYQQAHALLTEIATTSAAAVDATNESRRIPLFEVLKLDSLMQRLLALVSVGEEDR